MPPGNFIHELEVSTVLNGTKGGNRVTARGGGLARGQKGSYD